MRRVSGRIVIDEQGKITLPGYIMAALEWGPGRVLEVILDEDGPGVMIYKEVDQCYFCSDIEGPFYRYNTNLLICEDCHTDISALRPTLKEYLAEGAEQE